MMDRSFDPSLTLPRSKGTELILNHGVSRSAQALILLSKSLDAVIIGLVLVGAVTMYRTGWDLRYGMAVLVAVIVFLPVAEVTGLYRPWRSETLTRQFF